MPSRDGVNLDEPIELHPLETAVELTVDDARPRMPEPLPVRLVSVDDVRLPASAGVEVLLNAFYVELLGFERLGAAKPARRLVEPLVGSRAQSVTAPPVALGLRNRDEPTAPAVSEPPHPPEVPAERMRFRGALPGPVYRADNASLHFEILEGHFARETLRPIQIEVPLLGEAEAKLIEAELEYSRERGVAPGQESLLLLDPAGNWIELIEMKPIG